MEASAVPVEDLAKKVGAPRSLALPRDAHARESWASFARRREEKFALTPIGELLKTDAPGSLRYTAMMLGDEWSMRAYTHMTDCIRTGGDGITMAYGKQIFELFAERPEQAETFQRAMTGGSTVAAQSILGRRFCRNRRASPMWVEATAFCLPRSCGATRTWRASCSTFPKWLPGFLEDRLDACKGRLGVEAGSFFERVPEGCDAYVMKHIIHDWSDEHCRTILRLIREQLGAQGRLLVCEMVLSDDPGPSPAKMLDIEMLVMTVGGKERTPQEFSDLFASAGLKLGRIVPTPTPNLRDRSVAGLALTPLTSLARRVSPSPRVKPPDRPTP